MPPRHGQSQFISPVSSLNAPCCSASSSRDCGDGRSASAETEEVGEGAFGSRDEGEYAEGVTGAVGLSSGVGGRKRDDGEREARVGSDSSSICFASSSTGAKSVWTQRGGKGSAQAGSSAKSSLVL